MKTGKYSIYQYGSMENWDKHSVPVPPVVAERTGIKEVFGKRFCKKDLDLKYMDFSINKLAPGVELPFIHEHKEQEEVYLFLKGTGQFYADGSVIDITDGTAVKVCPGYKRTLRNTSLEEPLYYVCFRAEGKMIKEIPDDVPEPEMFDWDDLKIG